MNGVSRVAVSRSQCNLAAGPPERPRALASSANSYHKGLETKRSPTAAGPACFSYMDAEVDVWASRTCTAAAVFPTPGDESQQYSAHMTLLFFYYVSIPGKFEHKRHCSSRVPTAVMFYRRHGALFVTLFNEQKKIRKSAQEGKHSTKRFFSLAKITSDPAALSLSQHHFVRGRVQQDRLASVPIGPQIGRHVGKWKMGAG